MHRNRDFTMDHIGAMYFIHPARPDDFPSAGEMLTTNGTGAFLWEHLAEEISLKDLAGLLSGYYEIDFETASQDTVYFLETLDQTGALIRDNDRKESIS